VPHRRFWQHSLLQVHTGISHTPSHATWTEAATFAAECDELGETTAATLEQEATCLKPPTVEVLFELADDKLRQPAALFHPLAKRRPVRRDRLIQHRLFRTAPLVTVGTSGMGTRLMRSGRLGHPLGKANRVPVSEPQPFPSLEPADGVAKGDFAGHLPVWPPWTFASARLLDGRTDARHHLRKSRQHILLSDPQDPIASGSEHAVAPRVSAAATCVPAAIDFHDQARRARVVVCDVSLKDYLPTEDNTQL
jgi:hypothetical protein